LEAYSYAAGAGTAIRPSENTVVERIPPRLRIRRGAELETPHVMMLADDPARTLIEPIGRCKDRLPCLYDGELMLGGGRLAGWAVEDPDLDRKSVVEGEKDDQSNRMEKQIKENMTEMVT